MKKQQEDSLAVGVGMGVSFGMILGVLLDDIGLWLSLGICFGCALGASGAFSTAKPDHSKQTPDELSESKLTDGDE